MESIVEQVVRVLDEVGALPNVGRHDRDEFNRTIRAYRTRRKKTQHTPPKSTGELDTYNKVKERERKDVKRARPTAKLKYNNGRKKWEVVARDDLQKKEDIEEKYGLQRIAEITIRTGAIGIWLATVKKWASTIDSLAASMKSKASTLDNANTLEKRNKIEKELWTIQSDSDKALRKILIYGSLISAAGGLGADRSYKEIKKQLSKRRK